MNQQPDEQPPEIGEDGLVWHSIDHRNVPRDVVQPDPEAQRAALAELARRHANGERFYFTPLPEQMAYDSDGRPAAGPPPPETTAITKFIPPPSHDEQDDNEGDGQS